MKFKNEEKPMRVGWQFLWYMSKNANHVLILDHLQIMNIYHEKKHPKQQTS